MIFLYTNTHILIFVKSYAFDCRYAEQSEARKVYDMGGEKQINCVAGSTLFQPYVSVNVFKVEIYILKKA